MIILSSGNLVDSNACALVNPVNCVGVSRAGLSLQFKNCFPDNQVAYESACRSGVVNLGRVFVYRMYELIVPSVIINFPTNRHWRDACRIEDIEIGLRSLVTEVSRLKIQSIAIPALGCGHEDLNWADVKPLIERAFSSLPQVEVRLFEPVETTVVKKMLGASHAGSHL